MVLFIEPETSLLSLQHSFHQVYPFLTIRFFKKNVNASGIAERIWMDGKLCLKDVSSRSNLH
jgi:hypothetical protein